MTTHAVTDGLVLPGDRRPGRPAARGTPPKAIVVVVVETSPVPVNVIAAAS